MIQSFARRYPFWSFYFVAVAIVGVVVSFRIFALPPIEDGTNWLDPLFKFLNERDLYANIVSIAQFGVQQQPIALTVFLFAGAPTIAALIVAPLARGKQGLAELFSRFLPWRDGVTRRRGLAVYGVFALVYFGVACLYLLIARLYGGQPAFDARYAILGGTPLAALATLTIGAFIDEGATLEETGWRGFALPILIDRMRNPLVASIFLGVMWTFWHFPREIPGILEGKTAEEWGTFLYWQGVFVFLCVTQSIVITFMYNLTGGSIWPAILIHGGTNVWSKALSAPANEWLAGAATRWFGESAGGWIPADSRSLLVVAAAIVILSMAGPQLGARPRAPGEPGTTIFTRELEK